MAKLLILMCQLIFTQNSYSQIIEYKVQASNLYNFTNFVTWGQDIIAFNIGIYNEPPFDGALFETVVVNLLNAEGKLNWNVENYMSIDEKLNCHILFIPGSIKKSELIKLLGKVNKKSILTVGGNVSEFCELGGIINLTPNNLHRFEINNDAAINSRLRISSDLLDLRLTKLVKSN